MELYDWGRVYRHEYVLDGLRGHQHFDRCDCVVTSYPRGLQVEPQYQAEDHAVRRVLARQLVSTGRTFALYSQLI